MGTKACNFHDLLARHEPAFLQDAVQGSVNAWQGGLVDTAAFLADQERDHVMAAVLMGAGHEGVLGDEAMNEALFEQEFERPIHGDRRNAPPGPRREALGQVVGAEWTMRIVEAFQDLAADSGQPRTTIAANALRLRQSLRGLRGALGRMGAIVTMAVRTRSFAGTGWLAGGSAQRTWPRQKGRQNKESELRRGTLPREHEISGARAGAA